MNSCVDKFAVLMFFSCAESDEGIHVYHIPRSDDRIHDLRLFPCPRDKEQDV